MKREDNKRLRLIFDELKKQGKVKFIRDLAESIKYNESNLSLMIAGKRPVSPTVKQALCENFNVSLDYIYSHTGGMFGKSKLVSESESLKTQIQLLQKQLQLKEKIITLLEEQIKLLK